MPNRPHPHWRASKNRFCSPTLGGRTRATSFTALKMWGRTLSAALLTLLCQQSKARRQVVSEVAKQRSGSSALTWWTSSSYLSHADIYRRRERYLLAVIGWSSSRDMRCAPLRSRSWTLCNSGRSRCVLKYGRSRMCACHNSIAQALEKNLSVQRTRCGYSPLGCS